MAGRFLLVVRVKETMAHIFVRDPRWSRAVDDAEQWLYHVLGKKALLHAAAEVLAADVDPRPDAGRGKEALGRLGGLWDDVNAAAAAYLGWWWRGVPETERQRREESLELFVRAAAKLLADWRRGDRALVEAVYRLGLHDGYLVGFADGLRAASSAKR
ncbi:MAG TPA: hypothetical protein VIN09_12185 [Chloroflexota bacterium]